jgi:CRISPR-associated protein (TIGR02584 family)
MQRNVLLCLAGLTPQIITETLYALTHQCGERVDEIRVITTLAGRDRVMRELLDKQNGKFFKFCHEYDIDPYSINFNEENIRLLPSADKKSLKDIRSKEDNESAANEICDIVRKLTDDPNTRIHASAAGGRKTMSIYLTAAMQLFGRNYDRLSHVLVSEDFETHPDFYYIPRVPCELRDRNGNPLNTANARIHLADIPFIRLRRIISGWLPEGTYSYSDLVARAQDELNLYESLHDLRINLRHRTVTVASHSVKLPEREFFIYTLFACMRKDNRGADKDGFVSLEQIGRDDIDKVFRMITAARGLERSLDDHIFIAGFGFLDTLLEQLNSDLLALQETFSQVKSKIKRKLDKATLKDRYAISTDGPYGASRYGLQVVPERIIIS